MTNSNFWRKVRGNRPTILERFHRQSLQNRGVPPRSFGGGGGRTVTMGLPVVALARVAPRALPWIAKGARGAGRFLSGWLGGAKPAGLVLKGFLGYNVAQAFATRDVKRIFPSLDQIGTTIGSLGSVPGAIFGTARGQAERGGKSVLDILRNQSLAPPYSFDSVRDKVDIVPRWLGFGDVSGPDTNITYGGSTTNLSMPAGSVSVSGGGGGGGPDGAMLALLALLFGGGYALGRRRRKKKYKKRRSNRKS